MNIFNILLKYYWYNIQVLKYFQVYKIFYYIWTEIYRVRFVSHLFYFPIRHPSKFLEEEQLTESRLDGMAMIFFG